MHCDSLNALPLIAAFATLASAQQCPVMTDENATYPNPPLTYPMTSDRYSVAYQLAGTGAWTSAQVYISYYGGTTSSPSVKASKYAADESMSYVSIPTAANTAVAIRVTKIWGSNFPAIAQMSVRPTAKGIQISSVNATTVQLSTTTAANFAGDQFVLRWTGNAQNSGSIQGLGIFLDPPYTRPTGANVKVVTTPSDLAGNLSAFDTLDIEGTVAVGSAGAVAFIVPVNINNIFLGPGAWLQGKLRFTQSGLGNTRTIYGPGVLDVSRFNYANRQCKSSSSYPDDGYQSISWIPISNTKARDRFVVDGLIVADSNYYATDWFANSTLNNVKIIGWNGNNDGIQMGLSVSVSNVFVRTGDDSLKMWGSYITLTNATVWQGWNGGVINLGWSDNTPGDDSLIDGVYVVETDWSLSNTPSWSSTTLNSDNDAIVASLQVPGTNFGAVLPSLFRNIYVEDTPRVLFSVKILPTDCALNGNAGSPCPPLDPSLTSVLNLILENIFTPASLLQNSIGFQTVNGTPLLGAMNIALTNVVVTPANGTATVLNASNAMTLGVGNINTNGNGVNIIYGTTPTAILLSAAPSTVISGQAVTLTASLSPSSATGTVEFLDGNTSLGTANLSAGIAKVTVALAVGAHLLAASYSGGSTGGPSVSPALNLAVINPCDPTQNGTVTVADVQQFINQASGIMSAGSDLNGDSVVNVVDVQIAVNAILGLGCTASFGG